MQLLSSLLKRVSQGVLAPYGRVLLDLLQIEAAANMVSSVRTARQLFLGGLVMVILAMLAITGLVLAHFALYTLLPTPTNAIVLLALGILYLLVAALVLLWVSREKTWMELSGAAHKVDQATGKAPPD